MARKTSAQRYNENMERIFAQAKVNGRKHSPYHMTQELPLLLEKIKRVIRLRNSPSLVTEEDWTELIQHVNRTSDVLERLNESDVVKDIKAGITH